MCSRALAALGLALALVAGPLAAGRARADPPLWRVHGAGGAELVLFGSVHLLSDDVRWYTPELAAELARADTVLFEIPMDPAAQVDAQTEALAHGRLPEGSTLSTLLSPAGRERLRTVAATVGLPVPVLDRLQPWLAEALVSVSYFVKAGARTDLGVEQTLAHAAPATARQGALESVADQIAALSGATQADQVASLEETLKDIRDEPESFRRLVSEWARGDVKGLVKEELEPMRRDSPSVYKRLVVDRNRRWVGELEARLKSGSPGRTLVVVGVGHLVGTGGVPALLRRDGVRVEGP